MGLSAFLVSQDVKASVTTLTDRSAYNSAVASYGKAINLDSAGSGLLGTPTTMGFSNTGDTLGPVWLCSSIWCGRDIDAHQAKAVVPTPTRTLSYGVQNDFVITVKTNNAGTSSSTQFTIPTVGGGYNYNVDCDNDGTDEATARNGNYTCSYAGPGTFTVRTSGSFIH